MDFNELIEATLEGRDLDKPAPPPTSSGQVPLAHQWYAYAAKQMQAYPPTQEQIDSMQAAINQKVVADIEATFYKPSAPIYSQVEFTHDVGVGSDYSTVFTLKYDPMTNTYRHEETGMVLQYAGVPVTKATMHSLSNAQLEAATAPMFAMGESVVAKEIKASKYLQKAEKLAKMFNYPYGVDNKPKP